MEVQSVTQEEARTDVTSQRCELRFTFRVFFVPRKMVLVAADWEVISGPATKTKILPVVGNRNNFVHYVVSYFTG
jgi:hypothetical protein